MIKTEPVPMVFKELATFTPTDMPVHQDASSTTLISDTKSIEDGIKKYKEYFANKKETVDIPNDVLKAAIKMVHDIFDSKDERAASNNKPMIEAEGKSITWLGRKF